MPDFTVVDKFDPSKSFTRVVFGSDSVLLEVELNELQKIQNYQRALLARLLVTNGFVAKTAMTLSSSILTVPADTILVNGDFIEVLENMSLGVSSGDTVYAAISEVEVTSLTTLKKSGNLSGGSTITNDLLDGRVGEETTHRTQKQIQLVKSNSDTSKTYIPVATITSVDTFTDNRTLVVPTSVIQTQPLTIPHGLSLVTTDRKTPINALAFNGITRLNILGKDGNCEDISKWGYGGCSISLDSSNYAVGSNSIKITLTGTSGSMSNLLSKYNVDTTKYYVLLGYVKNGNATNVFIYKEASGGGTNKLCQTITDTTKFNSTYVKIQPSDLGSGNYLAVAVNGTSGQYAYVDGIRLYQIDQATYNLIDVDPEYTGDKLAEKYPYVDSYQVLQNPAVIVQGKNLLPPFYQWSTVTLDGLVISPYVMSFVKTDTSSYQGKFVNAPVIAGQNYVFSITVTSSGMGGTVGRGAYLEIYFYDDYGVSTGTKLVQDMLVVNGTANITQSITPPTGTKVIRVNLTTQHTVTGTFTFTNPMLNLGPTALPFEPADPSYQYFPCKLADGETLQEIDGQAVKTKKIQDVVLDGSLGWGLISSSSGYKRVYITNPANYQIPLSGLVAVKYDGKILTTDAGTNSASDQIANSASYIYLTISSLDSGWGDDFTPSIAEQQAYFYRWQMNNGTFGTPYNGTGTKTWIPLGATSNAGAVTVCPTADSTSTYDHYQLHYTLAQPTTEIIIPEGSLAMHDGLNQVELSEGVVVREAVVPQLYNGFWRICDTEITASNTKYRNKSLLAIYKNGIMDNHNWTIENNLLYSYGLFRAYTSTNFDPTAFYEVTYEVLDKYLYTTNALTATGTYDTNDHTVLGHTVEKVSEVETRVSVVERGKANAQQPNWIAPTLLNGWVNYGGINDTVAYFKDSLGMIHLKGFMSGGTLGVSAFLLPVGYRPLLAATFATVANNAIGAITVTSSGGVIMGANGLGTGWFSLSSIPPFRAEQ